MGKFKSATKTVIAAKIIEVVRREAAKPENQAKARELLSKVTRHGSSSKQSSVKSRIMPGGRRTTGHRTWGH